MFFWGGVEAESWLRWRWDLGIKNCPFWGQSGFCGRGLFGSGSSLGELGQSGLAAGSGVGFQEVFLDGLVVFGLSLGQILGGRSDFEGLEGGLDVFLELLVVRGALLGLARGFFGGFDDWHSINSLELLIYIKY